MSDAYDALRDHLALIHDLNAAAAVLEWDLETYMPDGAAEARGHQVATLRQLAHQRFTDDHTGTLLDAAADGAKDTHEHTAALLRVTRRDYLQARKLPGRLVAEEARATAAARQAWKAARETNTFATFAPHLQHLLDLSLEKTEAYGYQEERYDALLDLYEPGMKTATVAQVFDDLRDALVPLVHAIAQAPQPDDQCLRRRYPEQTQVDFGAAVIQAFGFDFDRGRQDRSAHPFCTAFSVNDVRLTTRVAEHFFNPAFFGTLHEAGHGMYEQGIDPALERTPLADGTSLGMHESQSRLWENLVGRSRPFWDFYYPRLQHAFPEALGEVPLDVFYRAINRVEPSLIRVEADEVTYNLHIMLRFALERELLAGRLAVADLPEAWNDRMAADLGIRPDTDADGVLQDIHWSMGAFGYFPTYSLGNLMSAQLFQQAQHDLGDLDDEIAQGQFANLREWLRDRVHRHGRTQSATEILETVTGDGLQAAPWLAYVQQKFGGLYGL